MHLEQLEQRDCPAVAIGDGVIGFGKYQVRPFEDWRGGLNFTETNGKVWVGPQPGGGPRVAVFDVGTGGRDRGDWFAGPPEDRSGIIPIPAETTTVVINEPTPQITIGSGGFVVYVDFNRPISSDFVRGAMNKAATTLAGLPIQLTLTTVRPSTYPGNYGTVNVGDDTYWYGGAGGYSQLGEWTRYADPWQERAVYVKNSDDATIVGRIIAHEAGHALGIEHNTDRNSVMAADAAGAVFTAYDIAQVKNPIGG